MILDLVQKLHDASIKSPLSPYIGIEWPQTFPTDVWAMSPELISIAESQTFKDLTDAQKKRLSFFECVNFFTLNIHGERALIQGLAGRLYARQEISPYLHDFLREENNHMVYFGTFCDRYAGKVYQDRKVAWPRAEVDQGEEDFLFFSKVMIFEEIVDVFNLEMSKDERLHPLVREINRRHHVEEIRHLVFGREMVKALWIENSPRWNGEKKRDLSNYLAMYFETTWREYFNPDVYSDAGLAGPFDLVEEALKLSRSSNRYKVARQNAMDVLVKVGLIDGGAE